MSLVTRCTACGTLFKVVADQLKISEGWVRCGQCAHVFDAASNLVEPALQPTAPVPTAPAAIKKEAASAVPTGLAAAKAFEKPPVQPPAMPVLPPAPEALEPTAPSPLLPTLPSLPAIPAVPMAASQAAAAQPPVETSSGDSSLSGFSSGFSSTPAPDELPGKPLTSSDSLQNDSRSFQPGKLRGDDQIANDDPGPTTSSWASSEYTSSQQEALEDAITTTPQHAATPSFVAQAQRAARWRSPWVRLGLILLALALLAVLALQVALHERDQIATMEPRARPLLEQLCQYADCKIQPMKRIEWIVIDASSFNRINKTEAGENAAQHYKLNVTLKNSGHLPVALPHVELSLQDQQDQPLLRRVLSPADLGLSTTTLAASQDLQGSLALQIDTARLGGQRISGYRVLAFYP